MLRSVLKTGCAGALSWTGAGDLLGRISRSRYRPLVVGYHRVVEDFDSEAKRSIPAQLTSLRTLEHQLDWIGRRCQFLPPDELGEGLESGRQFRRPVALVTFDDGYQDVYTHAFPLLKRKGIPALVFVVTESIDAARGLDHDALYTLLGREFSEGKCTLEALNRLLAPSRVPPLRNFRPGSGTLGRFAATRILLETLPQEALRRLLDSRGANPEKAPGSQGGAALMTWPMLREMSEAGITIGSHSATHPLLTQESRERVGRELVESRRRISRRLQAAIRHFAYPDGGFDVGVVREVAAAGYRFGYTVCRHLDPFFPLLTIPRKMLWEKSCLDALGRFSPAVMSCQANGIFDFASPCRRAHA